MEKTVMCSLCSTTVTISGPDLNSQMPEVKIEVPCPVCQTMNGLTWPLGWPHSVKLGK